MNKKRQDILNVLHHIDNHLNTADTITICGAAALILQGYDFRNTMDIDLTKTPTTQVNFAIQKSINNNRFSENIIDYNSIGIVQLLEDYEDRLVEIEDGFAYLKVFVLSKLDWAVSKLNSPKLNDLIDYGIMNSEELQEVRMNMGKYCGLNDYKALFDLDIVMMHIKDKQQEDELGLKKDNDLER